MTSTPVKTPSRRTPRSKYEKRAVDETHSNLSSYEARGVIYTPKEALALLLNLSSPSSSDEDDEWIVTKPKPNGVSRSISTEYKDEKVIQSTRSKGKVSPLKLLRKPEYEVNKLPSTCKKSEEAVSPIIIKRKEEKGRRYSCAETPINLVNVPSTSNADSPRRSQRKKSAQNGDAGNELVLPESTNTNNSTEGKKKKGRKPKRQNVELELSFEDRVRDMRITETPPIPVDSTKTNGDIENVNLNGETYVLHGYEEKFHRTTQAVYVKSPFHPTFEDDENNFELVATKSYMLRGSSRKSYTNQIFSDSDDDFGCGPSPPKRRQTRKSAARRSRSSQKAVKNTPNKSKEVCQSSPEKKTPHRSQISQTSSVDSPSLLKHVLTPKGTTRRRLLNELNPPPNEIEETPSCSSWARPETPSCSTLARPETPSSRSLARQVVTPRVSSARKKLDLPSTPVSAMEIDEIPSCSSQAVTPRVSSARKKLDLPSTPVSTKKVSCSSLTPVAPERGHSSMLPSTPLEQARMKLHTGNIPDSLPCREAEFESIYNFVAWRIMHRSGGCMYISGVPGTGKTATVTAVINKLLEEVKQERMNVFTFVNLNGLHMAEPHTAYVRLWLAIKKQKKTGEEAMHALDGLFNSNENKPVIILLDELDYLCNKRQDVIYNILEWSTKSESALTVLTIANTMDLPERLLKGKVTSRMGLTRLVFLPYTFAQLQEIVLNRLNGSKCFDPDAIQFAARKVAAVSGDARRALDICKAALTGRSDNEIVKVEHINQAIETIYNGNKLNTIRQLGYMSKLVLRAMIEEQRKRGTDQMNISQVFTEMQSISAFEGNGTPLYKNVVEAVTQLAECGLIFSEACRNDQNMKLTLNVSAEDVNRAIVHN